MGSNFVYSIKLRFAKVFFPINYRFKRSKFSGLGHSTELTVAASRINRLIEARGLASVRYLEIGIENGNTFRNVEAFTKTGVDPFPLISLPYQLQNLQILPKKSDAFFRDNALMFDFVYLDGLHHYQQTYKDLINSFNRLSQNGLVLVDDIVPIDYPASLRSQIKCQEMKHREAIQNNYWMGDVYKIVYLLTKFHPEIHFMTIMERDQNPQLICWRSDSTSTELLMSRLNEFESLDLDLSYESVFSHGIPNVFNTKSFAHCISHLRR